MPNTAKLIKLHAKTRTKLTGLKNEAERAGEYRVAKRIHAVLLSDQKNTRTTISTLLNAPRSCVNKWLTDYESHGYESLLKGQRSGRPGELLQEQLFELGEIIDKGPLNYGYTSAIWSSLMIRDIIAAEFGVTYHAGHVRKLLHQLDFSVQKPKRILARADEALKNQWRRYTYPNIKKKPAH